MKTCVFCALNPGGVEIYIQVMTKAFPRSRIHTCTFQTDLYRYLWHDQNQLCGDLDLIVLSE